MSPSITSRLTGRPRLVIALIATALVLVLLVAFGVYGLIRGPATTPETETDPGESVTIPPTQPETQSEWEPQPVTVTSDGEVFARSVAQRLYTWDTTAGEVAEYAQMLVDVANPSGREASGLAADVRAHLPSREAWASLRTHQTRQWITIDDLYVPAAWAEAEAQARPGQLPPGATAYTLSGTRHRDGIWGTEPVEAEHDIEVTIFLACPPPTPNSRDAEEAEEAEDSPEDEPAATASENGQCYLLRLSAPGQALH